MKTDSFASDYDSAWKVMWIIVIVQSLFVAFTPLFPFIDLPNHLAEATIYKYHGDPENTLASYYVPVPWYYPNTFHTVFCSLFPDVEWGNRVFHILYIITLQLSVFLVIKHLKGNPWYGLLVTIFTFNYNVTFGFVGFAIAIPAIILLFYFTLREIDKQSLGLKLFIGLLFILIFLMHAQAALFALVLYALMMLITYFKTPLRVAQAALVPLPTAIIIFVWWLSQESPPEEGGSTLAYLWSYYTTTYFPELFSRVRLAIFDNYQLADGLAGGIIALLLFATMLVPFFFHKAQHNKTQLLREAFYPLILLVCALSCYLFLPTGLPGQSPLSQRFCTLVNIALVITLSVAVKGAGPRLRNFSVAVCVIYIALWFEYIISFNVQNKSFRSEFFADMRNDQKLAGLIYENAYRRSKVYIHFPNYFIVWKRGVATTKIIDYRFGVVRRNEVKSGIPFYDEYVGDNYKHLVDYNDQDYLLVRGRAPVTKDVNLLSSTLLRETGEWRLYSNVGKATPGEQGESPSIVASGITP